MSKQARQAERKLHEQAFPSEAITRSLEDRITILERQLAEAQEKMTAVDKEIRTVTDYGTKTCEHAVCGLARRIAAILGEKGA